jgi:hypothetical protein
MRCAATPRASRAPGRLRLLLREAEHALPASLQAMQDVLFLHPDTAAAGPASPSSGSRRPVYGQKACRWSIITPSARTRVGELLGRLGYELVDEIYAKRLDKKSEEKWAVSAASSAKKSISAGVAAHRLHRGYRRAPGREGARKQAETQAAAAARGARRAPGRAHAGDPGGRRGGEEGAPALDHRPDAPARPREHHPHRRRRPGDALGA